MSEWVSVKERLPEYAGNGNMSLLVCLGGRVVTEAIIKQDDPRFYAGSFNFYYPNVTHWMPLPAPPKEGT